MSPKNPRKGNRWSPELRAEALELLSDLGGDTRSAERVLLSRHGRAGTPSERQLRRWWKAHQEAAPTPAPERPPAPSGSTEGLSPKGLLERAAGLLELAERSPSLSPGDRARVATALAQVATRLADQEPRDLREARVRLEGLDLSTEEVALVVEWIEDYRRREGMSDRQAWDELERALRELVDGGQRPELDVALVERFEGARPTDWQDEEP